MLSRIKDLRLVARTVVEGFLAGQHLDRRPGVGTEFSQYRSYQPGDDLRRVDWRVFARSDRYYIRESEVERDVTVRFVIDASGSMAHRAGELSKFDYARYLVASLAYLVELQGDRIGFHAVGPAGDVALPTHRGRRPLLQLLHLLERLEPSGVWPTWEELAGKLLRSRGRELVLVISDLHQETDEIRRTLAMLRSAGHELLVLQLMERDELEFPYRGDVLFEDLETGRHVRGAAEAMRTPYLERLRRELEDWRVWALNEGAAYELLPTDRPLDRALRSFLLRRRRMGP